MMQYPKLASVQPLASQNIVIPDRGNDAEDGHAIAQLAGDQALERSDADLHIEDSSGPTTFERDQIPVEQAGDETDSPKSPLAAKRKVMSTTGKTNGTTPTPTVKKVLNSGTFGAGSIKPIGGKAPVTATVVKPTAPALKKSTTSPPSAPTKSAPPSSAPSKPSAINSRRTSVVPAKTASPALSKQSLSASATSKPTEAAVLRASPTGSVGSTKSPAQTPVPNKPRASVSAEAAKKPSLTTKSTVATSAKHAGPSKMTSVPRSSVTPATKASRPMVSISSIKEVKEGSSKDPKGDDKAINEVKSQLDEAKKLLESRTTAVADLEAKIVQLEESLASASVDIDAKANTAAELEKAMHSTEAMLAESRDALNSVQDELDRVKSSHESLENELEATMSTISAKEEVEQLLQSQLRDLEAVVAIHKEQISELEKNHATAAAKFKEASAIERDALLTAQANNKAMSDEIEALKDAHTKTVEDLEGQISKLKIELAGEEALQTQLKAEKEETANKISELEVEVLELKEAQEGLEDARNLLQKRVEDLELDSMNVRAAIALAAEKAKLKEAEYATALEELSARHKKDLEDAAAQLSFVTAALEKSRADHTEALTGHDQTKRELVNQGTKHRTEVEDLEKVHADALASLTFQLEQVSQRLGEQEALYNSKVDVIKDEHAKLLEEAFEHAKSEAAHAHGQELQTLRSDSNQTIEQLREANRVSLEVLKAEHTSQMETEVNGLNKQINTLSIELRATQDDLAKAKASLEMTRVEIDSLTQQRDEARMQAGAAPAINPEQTEEIARLTRELSTTKDDLDAMTDMVKLTKSSMEELSDKQAKELEAVERARADEVLQLRAAHDEEVSHLATQKSELQVRISDLEGDLATVKATLAAKEATPAKENGGASHPPSSPGVAKELQQLHEAHNLKIYDLQAEHDKEMKLANAELDTALGKIGELQDDISRKAMEIRLLEQDQEEQQEQITRLKEDVENLSEKLAQQSTSL